MGIMMRCCAFGALAFVSVAYAAQCTTEKSEIPGIQARLDMCPASAPFWGFMGCMMSLVFSCLGAAYGTAKSGVGVGNMGGLHADMVMKSIIPIIMAWLPAWPLESSAMLVFGAMPATRNSSS